MKIRGMTLGALWQRGWWVLLMIIIANIVLGFVTGFVGRLLRPFIPDALSLAAALILVTIAPVFLGWLFEEFAAARPRLRQDAEVSSGAV